MNRAKDTQMVWVAGDFFLNSAIDVEAEIKKTGINKEWVGEGA